MPEYHFIDAAPTPVGPFCHATEVDGWVFLTGPMQWHQPSGNIAAENREMGKCSVEG